MGKYTAQARHDLQSVSVEKRFGAATLLVEDQLNMSDVFGRGFDYDRSAGHELNWARAEARVARLVGPNTIDVGGYSLRDMIVGTLDRFFGFDMILFVEHAVDWYRWHIEVGVKGRHETMTIDLSRFDVVNEWSGIPQDVFWSVYESVNHLVSLRDGLPHERYTFEQELSDARYAIRVWETNNYVKRSDEDEALLHEWVERTNQSHGRIVAGAKSETMYRGHYIIRHRPWSAMYGNDTFSMNGRYSPRHLEVFDPKEKEMFGTKAEPVWLLDLNGIPNHLSENIAHMHDVLKNF